MSVLEDVGAAQLGHRLAQLREQSGMKQAELAKQVTWSQAVLSRVEAGERSVSGDELETLLSAIGTSEASELAAILHRNWSLLPRPALDHPNQQLLWQAEQVATDLRTLAEEPDVRQAFQRLLDEYVEEINRLAQLLLMRDHQVAFVGSIGIGKSTAICRATGLEIKSHERPVPVLETGGGGITLCEVYLREGPGYGFIVEPRTYDEIRADVTDFVDQLLRSEDSSTDLAAEGETIRAVPTEIERAIRNMTGLQPKRAKGPDGKIVRSDPAKDLARENPSKRELAVEILAGMDLHRRDRRDAWFDPAIAGGPLEWMKVTFEQINNGRHPDFSLPRRIELVVPVLMNVAGLGISIIDTRGIDQLTARADLETHLQDPHTVSILCSSFNDAPEHSAKHLLQRARDMGNAQIDSNCCVLVLARPEEALAVKDESGMRVESTQEGYELKSEQVSKALSPYRLESLPVGFFNAFGDDPAQLQDFIRDRVVYTRIGFQDQLQDVLTNARNILENFELEQVQEVQREAGRHVNSWIGLHQQPSIVRNHVYDSLLDEIATAHASTVHAAIRREGEWQALSYSHQLGFGARRIAVFALRKTVNGFTELCETLADSQPEAKELLLGASRLMSQAYGDLLRKMQVAGQTMYREQLHQDSRFWLECEDEWGRGSGYRNRIAGRNSAWFTDQQRFDIEEELRTLLEREWSSLLRRLGSIFETA